ncbi:hypothetical protein NS383_18995 [Pseudomonas oryzihabitans]|nr:hypothetical protein NS383_18995 [Pseudomonas psychrotolerans]
MGIIITAKTDGFRRGGIAHSAAGTHYPEGYFTEAQLEAFRREPQLVVVEGAAEAPSDDAAEARLVAADQRLDFLEDLVESLTERLATSEDQVQVLVVRGLGLAQQLGELPGLIVADLSGLERADPTLEGVLCLKADQILAVIQRFTQALIQNSEQGDASTPTPGDSAGTSEAAAGAEAAAPVPQAPGADAPPVTDQKPAGGKAARGKASKDAGKQEGDNA